MCVSFYIVMCFMLLVLCYCGLVLLVGYVGCYVNCGYVFVVCSKIRVRKFLILVGW